MLLESPGVVGRVHLWIYIGLQSVLVILCVLDLALNTWFHYCLWDFGLVYAHSFSSYIEYLTDESTIGDVQEDMCWVSIVYIELVCPRFCEYVGKFKDAGVAMVILGTLTLATAIVAIVMHAFALRNRPFKHCLVWVWLSMPTALWLLGTIMYGGAIDLTGTANVRWDQDFPGKKAAHPKNAEPDAGLIFCACLVVLHFLLLVYAVLTTRKNFQRD